MLGSGRHRTELGGTSKNTMGYSPTHYVSSLHFCVCSDLHILTLSGIDIFCFCSASVTLSLSFRTQFYAGLHKPTTVNWSYLTTPSITCVCESNVDESSAETRRSSIVITAPPHIPLWQERRYTPFAGMHVSHLSLSLSLFMPEICSNATIISKGASV